MISSSSVEPWRSILNTLKIIVQKLKIAGLKLKESKCDFFKSEIHYLGHLISDKGIQPLPEKLDTIRNMPHPRTPKEIKQFLGLTGYYRKICSALLRNLQTSSKADSKRHAVRMGLHNVCFHLKC